MSSNNTGKTGDNPKIWYGQIESSACWKDNEEPTKWDDDKELPGWGARYKVRIFGKHPENRSELSDDDLPWCEVMYPVTAGTGHAARYQSSNLTQGSFVVGIYKDQQEETPLIIGCIANNDQTELVQEPREGFEPRTGYNEDAKVPVYCKVEDGKPIEANSPNTVREENEADDDEDYDGKKKNTLRKTTKCGGSDLSGIQVSIRNFIQDTQRFKSKLQNFPNSLIREGGKSYGLNQYIEFKADNISKEIARPIKSLIEEIKKFIEKKINNTLKDVYYNLFPEDRPKAKTAGEKVLEAISCLFNKIVDSLLKMIGNFLMEIVDRFINVPLCAVENFVSGLLGNLLSFITGAIDAILQPFQAVLGVIDLAGDILGFVADLLGFFICEEDRDCPDVKEWSIWDGSGDNGISLDFNSIFNKAKSLKDSIGGSFSLDNFNFDLDFSSVIGDTLNSCNVGPILSGPPRLSIYGGNGSGTTGNLIISDSGEILGADISTIGSGYTQEPFVKIIDDCGKGKGAVARPVMGLTPPPLRINVERNSNGTYNISWRSTRTGLVETSFGMNDLNGSINVNPEESTTYIITAFSKRYRGKRASVTERISINPRNNSISRRRRERGIPIKEPIKTVINTNPEYPTGPGGTLVPGPGGTLVPGPGGTLVPGPGGTLVPGVPGPGVTIITPLNAKDSLSPEDIGMVNIIVEDSGFGYLRSSDGSLGGDNRTWARPDQTIVRRVDGRYDTPYSPGNIIRLNRFDQVTFPGEPPVIVGASTDIISPPGPGGTLVPGVLGPGGTPVTAGGTPVTAGGTGTGNFPSSGDGTYPVFLSVSDAVILDPGFNYNPSTDRIRIVPDNGAELRPVFGPNGSIIDIDVINEGYGFTERPSIIVETETGFNAEIVPILSVNRIDDEEEIADSQISPQSIIKVVDCVGKFNV